MQIIGSTGTTAEVDANTRALHTVYRPLDYGALGVYCLAGNSGIMAAGFVAFSTCFSFRWGVAAAKYALIHRVSVSMAVDTVVLPAGSSGLELYVVRGFTGADSGGTTLTPTGNANKLRTSMVTSSVADVRISSTTNLTLGTRTVDNNALGMAYAGNGQAVIGFPLIPKKPLFYAQPGEFPLILEGNEGFIIKGFTGATGTWKFGVEVYWSEVADITSYLEGTIQ